MGLLEDAQKKAKLLMASDKQKIQYLEKDEIQFSDLSDTDKQNENLILAAIRRDASIINNNAIKAKKTNFKFIASAASVNGMVLQYIDTTYRNDEPIARLAIQNNPQAFEFVGDTLRNNELFVLSLAFPKMPSEGEENNFFKSHPHQILYIGSTLLNQAGFIRQIMGTTTSRSLSQSLNLTSLSITTHREALTALLEQGILKLEDASESIKQDGGLILAAITHDASAIQHADKSLSLDERFLLKAAAENGLVLEHIENTHQNYKNIVLNAMHNTPKATQYINTELFKDSSFKAAVITRIEREELHLTDFNTEQQKALVAQLLCNNKNATQNQELLTAARNYISRNNKDVLATVTNQALLTQLLKDPTNHTLIDPILTQAPAFPQGFLENLCDDNPSFKKNLSQIMSEQHRREAIIQHNPTFAGYEDEHFSPINRARQAVHDVVAHVEDTVHTVAKAITGESETAPSRPALPRDLMQQTKKEIKLARLVLNEDKKQKELTTAIERFVNNINTKKPQDEIDASFKALCIKVCEHRWEVRLEGKTSNVFVAYVTKNFNRLAEFLCSNLKGGRLEAIYNKFRKAKKEDATTATKKTTDATPLLDLETKSAKGFIKLLTDNPQLRDAVGIKSKSDQEIEAAIKEKIQRELDTEETSSMPSGSNHV